MKKKLSLVLLTVVVLLVALAAGPVFGSNLAEPANDGGFRALSGGQAADFKVPEGMELVLAYDMPAYRLRYERYQQFSGKAHAAVLGGQLTLYKNESGKTAFLQALRRLNPVSGIDARFDLKDYPRKGYVRYKRTHKDLPADAVRAEFELSDREIEEIEAAFGTGVLKSPLVVVARDYASGRHWELDLGDLESSPDPKFDAGRPDGTEVITDVTETWGASARQNGLKVDVRQRIIDEYLERFLPRFVYFDNYSTMRGRISIQELQGRQSNGGHIDDADRTFLSLLSLVGIELQELQNLNNYEYLKAELESASIGISDEIFEFWNQNRELRVDFDLSPANPDDRPPLNSGTILHVRIWNNRHRVSVPFDERSRGFVWFFSFLSYFSKLEEEENADLILLLDEPGLNLHAMAQNDFLRFIDGRLAPRHQVIYTTHSPFMINLDRLSRVRTVQDMDGKGTVISDDTVGNDPETVFPLQVALGYQMARTLFLTPHCLFVNASSDLIYLQVLGEMVASKGRVRLDPRWVVIPVGGADNLPTFASLLEENYVSVAVLMDVTPTNKERVERLNQHVLEAWRNPIKWVEVTRVRDADIEDLFEPGFYLKLVTEAYAAHLRSELTLKAITDSNPRIVRRIAAYFQTEGTAGGRFDRYVPAAYLLQKHAAFQREIDDATIERAAALFERINSLLPEVAEASSVDGARVRSLIPTA